MNKDLNFQIIEEFRSNARVSITKKGVVIRIPKNISFIQKEEFINKFKLWAINKLNNKNNLDSIIFDDLSKIHILDNEYQIMYHQNNNINNSNIISLNLNKNIEYSEEKIKDVLLKKIQLQFFEEMNKRVNYINANTLNQKYNNLNIKKLKSKWGSCDSNKNITFSTFLLFCPLWVIDYVIIHELCHLVYMNHSINFWTLVQKFYPNFKKAKTYLKNLNLNTI